MTEFESGSVETSSVDRVDSAKQVFETVKMLWDDQVELAASLKDRRKLYATLLGATGAIGIFRFAWTRPYTEVSVFPCFTAEYVIKGLVVLGILCLGWACLYIFQEGSVVDTDELPEGPPAPITIYDDWSTSALPDPPTVVSSRAIARIDTPNDVDRAALADVPPDKLWILRAAELRAAYTQLVVDNNQVKGRLRSGLGRLGFGYGLIALALILYTVVSTRGPFPMPPAPTKASKAEIAALVQRKLALAHRVAQQYTRIAALQHKAQQKTPLSRIKSKIAV